MCTAFVYHASKNIGRAVGPSMQPCNAVCNVMVSGNIKWVNDGTCEFGMELSVLLNQKMG